MGSHCLQRQPTGATNVSDVVGVGGAGGRGGDDTDEGGLGWNTLIPAQLM